MNGGRSDISSRDGSPASNVASAYDDEAAGYDAGVESDRRMRRQLRELYLRSFRDGGRLLDVGCGTGTDALFLARRGYEVVGCDVSAAMLRQLDAKAERAGLADCVEARRVDAALRLPWPDESFDGMLSVFGVLNTVADLSAFAAEAGRVLRPEGRLVVHMVNRFSIWEWMHLLRRGRWRAAARLGRRDERTFLVGGRPVVHYMPASDEAFRCFEPHFSLLRQRAFGVVAPPPHMEQLPTSVTTVLTRLEERLAGRPPLTRWGRFFLLELSRRSG